MPKKIERYKGPEERAPGRYIENVSIATSYVIPGLSDPNDKGGVNSWSGNAVFHGDEGSSITGSRVFDVAWSCKYGMSSGAEARCRTATRKAVAALQDYYDRTGKRWEVLRKKSRYHMPKLPPADAE